MSWECAIAESTFHTLAVRALQLARRPVGPSVWQDWAEFLVDTLPHYQEDLQDSGQDRASYLRSRTFIFTDESVLACRQKEREVLTERPVQPAPRLYAPGLAALRDRLNMSQEDFAEMIRYSSRSVQRWEKGKPISPNAVRRICHKCGCRPEDFTSDKPLAKASGSGN